MILVLRATSLFASGVGFGLALLLWQHTYRNPPPHWSMYAALFSFIYTLAFTFAARLEAFSTHEGFGFRDAGALGVVALIDLTLAGLLHYYRTAERKG